MSTFDMNASRSLVADGEVCRRVSRDSWRKLVPWMGQESWGEMRESSSLVYESHAPSILGFLRMWFCFLLSYGARIMVRVAASQV